MAQGLSRRIVFAMMPPYNDGILSHWGWYPNQALQMLRAVRGGHDIAVAVIFDDVKSCIELLEASDALHIEAGRRRAGSG